MSLQDSTVSTRLCYDVWMKILFVCAGNVGRSQMAEAFYNTATHTKDANSVGTRVEIEGQSLGQRKLEHPGHSFVVDIMNELGIDVSKSVSTHLTKNMLNKYDKVISMASKKLSPNWLVNAPNYIYWRVNDPMGKNRQVTVKARDIIRLKIDELLKQSN